MRKALISVLIMLLLVGCGQSSIIEVNKSDLHDIADAPPMRDTGTKVDSKSMENCNDLREDETMDSDLTPSETETQVTVPAETFPKANDASGRNEPPPTEPVPSATVPPEPPTEDIVPPTTEPEQTQPAETEPSEPEPTEPISTEPATTEPASEQIDTAALETYGRSYASSTYGYNGTSACGPSSGAGYFPGATKEILTMEDGYSLVRQAVDSQYRRDIAYGYSPYEEIDGVIVRCPINIRIEATGQPNVYVIWVYYGGDA